MDELKPCPFCGGKPAIAQNKNRKDWIVFCHNDCCVIQPETFWVDTKEEAVKAWNRRMNDETLPV